MSRLTERYFTGEVGVAECGNNCKYGFRYCEDCAERCPAFEEIYNKLAHYEDLEEQLEKLYGGRLSLDNVVDNLNRIVQNGEERLDFARILTNAEAEKWDKWKDLEEQGKLVLFPSYAYFIKDKKVHKGWVQEVMYWHNRKPLYDIRYDDNSLANYRGYLGLTVFLTKEEAEEALKRLQGNE